MTSSVEIEHLRSAQESLVNACFEIVLSLPEYFDESAHETIPRNLISHDLHVARDAGEVKGFVTIERKSEKVAEISWIAVASNARRTDIGTSLLDAVVEELRESRVWLLVVKTLAEEAGYAPYEGTRRFYEERGFALVETIDPYLGWEPGNPCAIYVRSV